MGVAIIAYRLQQVSFPSYPFSESRLDYLESHLEPYFSRIDAGRAEASDLVVSRLDRSLHFVVSGSGTFIHADRRVLKVVETPGDAASLPSARIYRMHRRFCDGDVHPQ